MADKWNQEMIEVQYISAQAEESPILEYKGAGALGKTDGKKTEITKDVSSMANAAGGIIIYGVREFDTDDKKHLPERLDPIDRTEFSKEWLEQVVNNIRPRIEGLTIHPVPINSAGDPNHAVYVLEIPKSTTAHQATDLKYYRRYNFQAVAMQDHEIRDVMNRAATPDADVEFSFTPLNGPLYLRRLDVLVENKGLLVVNHWKLDFAFPDLDLIPKKWLPAPDKFVFLAPTGTLNVQVGKDKRRIRVVCRSGNVLFPKDKEDLGQAINLQYLSPVTYWDAGDIPPLEWVLYADHMLPKQGQVSIF